MCETSMRKATVSSCWGPSSKFRVSLKTGSLVPCCATVFFFFTTRPFALS